MPKILLWQLISNVFLYLSLMGVFLVLNFSASAFVSEPGNADLVQLGVVGSGFASIVQLVSGNRFLLSFVLRQKNLLFYLRLEQVLTSLADGSMELNI